LSIDPQVARQLGIQLHKPKEILPLLIQAGYQTYQDQLSVKGTLKILLAGQHNLENMQTT
jgi:hypothetical protein